MKTKPGGNGAAGRKVKDSASGAITGKPKPPERATTAAALPGAGGNRSNQNEERGENIMVEIVDLKQFNRAKLRASVGKLVVTESTVDRQWRVTNEENGKTYRVTFMKGADGRKFATCECEGGQGGYVCKHMGKCLPLALELALAVEARERLQAQGARLPRDDYNPAFDEETAAT